HAVDHVVQTPLEHDDQIRARGPFGVESGLEIVAELAFEQSVGALHLLLLAQLNAVSHHLRAPVLAVLSGDEVALFDRAFFRKTPETLEEEFHPFPAAQPANCFTMSCQVLLSFFSN